MTLLPAFLCLFVASTAQAGLTPTAIVIAQNTPVAQSTPITQNTPVPQSTPVAINAAKKAKKLTAAEIAGLRAQLKQLRQAYLLARKDLQDQLKEAGSK